MKHSLPFLLILSLLQSCTRPASEPTTLAKPSQFEEDVTFLQKYSDVIVLSDAKAQSRVAVMPALQGRIMTSTSGNGESYGWINRTLFESGDTSIHINAFGGEERFWLGPEGGQFSIFFEKGKDFNLDNWRTPRLIDLEPYDLVSSTRGTAVFKKTAQLTNYSGTTLSITINREIQILEPAEAFQQLGVEGDTTLKPVAFRTVNSIENSGTKAWNKKTGLLSIWLLGMFNPSPEMTVIIPFQQGPEDELGTIVNDDYFGKVPADRLKVKDNVIYFKGDGTYRSKIGLTPSRAKDVLGSYDPATGTLTVVTYNKPDDAGDYVNSKWEIQDEPYKGDVVNSYNDGPPAPGAKPLGPFYELETSSPAKELKPGEKLDHIQTTFHFQGNETSVGKLTKAVFGVSIEEIKAAFE
jgi:hypothetical protein